MRYLSTVYVRDHRAHVQHRRGSLLVSSPDGSERIPLEAIDAVVMLGSAQVTTQALEACVRRGVRVTALQMSGARFGLSLAGRQAATYTCERPCIGRLRMTLTRSRCPRRL